ncbi:MAG: Tetratricopeptide TPR3 [Candidatus Peregrinibacteria bacterium Greene0416_19]|nr:MAG: Tetratricopeptide TPR3 [Candidatus Peregrinibacteria bacterium Greene0416_19]
MADPSPPASGLVIPADLQATFGGLVALIKESESMNDEERQYWINILPIMTPDQVKNLQQILESERRQLAEIDRQYATEIGRLGQSDQIRQTGEERRQRRGERQSKEESHRSQEEQNAESILKQIEND